MVEGKGMGQYCVLEVLLFNKVIVGSVSVGFPDLSLQSRVRSAS